MRLFTSAASAIGIVFGVSTITKFYNYVTAEITVEADLCYTRYRELVEKAERCMEDKNYKEAARHWKQACEQADLLNKKYPQYKPVNTQHILAGALERTGDIIQLYDKNEAIDYYKKSINLPVSFQSSTAYSSLSKLLYKRGKYQEVQFILDQYFKKVTATNMLPLLNYFDKLLNKEDTIESALHQYLIHAQLGFLYAHICRRMLQPSLTKNVINFDKYQHNLSKDEMLIFSKAKVWISQLLHLSNSNLDPKELPGKKNSPLSDLDRIEPGAKFRLLDNIYLGTTFANIWLKKYHQTLNLLKGKNHLLRSNSIESYQRQYNMISKDLKDIVEDYQSVLTATKLFMPGIMIELSSNQYNPNSFYSQVSHSTDGPINNNLRARPALVGG